MHFPDCRRCCFVVHCGQKLTQSAPGKSWEDPAVLEREMKSQEEQAQKDAEQMVKDMEKAAKDAEKAAKDAGAIPVPPLPPVPPGAVPSLTSPKGSGHRWACR